MKFEFDNDDNKLEAQLRQFRPQSPRPLPDRSGLTRNRRSSQIVILGAAAAVILVAIFFSARSNKLKTAGPTAIASQMTAEPVTLGQLRRLADDPAQLDSQLDSLSQVLPDVRHKGGVLSKLAQESR